MYYMSHLCREPKERKKKQKAHDRSLRAVSITAPTAAPYDSITNEFGIDGLSVFSSLQETLEDFPIESLYFLQMWWIRLLMVECSVINKVHSAKLGLVLTFYLTGYITLGFTFGKRAIYKRTERKEKKFNHK